MEMSPVTQGIPSLNFSIFSFFKSGLDFSPSVTSITPGNVYMVFLIYTTGV